MFLYGTSNKILLLRSQRSYLGWSYFVGLNDYCASVTCPVFTFQAWFVFIKTSGTYAKFLDHWDWQNRRIVWLLYCSRVDHILSDMFWSMTVIVTRKHSSKYSPKSYSIFLLIFLIMTFISFPWAVKMTLLSLESLNKINGLKLADCLKSVCERQTQWQDDGNEVTWPRLVSLPIRTGYKLTFVSYIFNNNLSYGVWISRTFLKLNQMFHFVKLHLDFALLWQKYEWNCIGH